MATKPNKNIKKLSTAILHGLAIGKEAGIKKAEGELIKVNDEGEVCRACTLGFALIGVLGVDGAKKVATSGLMKGYNFLEKQFGDKGNACLPKQVTKKQKELSGIDIIRDYDFETGDFIGEDKVTPQDFVMGLNDNTGLRPDQIAKKLANCKL